MNLKKITSFVISAAMTSCMMNFPSAYAENGIVTSKTLDTAFSVSDNIYYNNYIAWNTPVYSYLYENDDNTITKAECSYDESTFTIDNYSSDLELLSSMELSCELPIFGGAYSGSNYNYLVFGQSNSSDSSSAEVMRVVQYDKSWNRINSLSIKGANTRYPFSAGSLRMCESNGTLYIHTCHTMFKTSDGLNHQANMTFAIDTASMTEIDSYYGVMNIGYGYISHSFNQFIKSSGEYVYRADHGDAYERGITITKFKEGDSVTNVEYTNAFPIQGTIGANDTGVSLGGFELSDYGCLTAGNSVDQSSAENYSSSAKRDIFLTLTNENLEKSNTLWLTEYPDDKSITPTTPKLVKYDTNKFLLMWDEVDNSDDTTLLVMMAIDLDADTISDAKYSNIALSDCEPIAAKDGYIKWYITDSEKTTLFSVYPDALFTCEDDFILAESLDPVIPGDVDGNGTVELTDATIVLTMYAKSAASIELDETEKRQLAAADVNKNGSIDLSDATEVLSIYARNAAGL